MFMDRAGTNERIMSFIHGQNSSALFRLVTFDFLVSQSDRHPEHIWVGRDGDASRPLTIDSAKTTFNYRRLNHMMIPGTTYHDRAQLGSYYGIARQRDPRNSNLWPFDYH